MRSRSQGNDSQGTVQPTRRALLQAAVGFGALGLDLSLARPALANDLRLGKPAPPATLVTLDGRRITTTDLKGNAIILTFWATWCGPCRQELPLLSEYASRHASQGLIVLGFTLDPPEALPKVQKMAQRLSFPVGLLEYATLPGYGRIWRV